MEIESPLRFYPTPFGMTIIKKMNKYMWEWGETGAATMETSMEVAKKEKTTT